MSEERPQDAGRRHRKHGAPSQATLTLLARYQQAMRDALTRTLDRIEARPPTQADGTLGLATPLSADAEAKAWDVAIKLARELATEIDPAGAGGSAGVADGRPRRQRAPRRAGVDFGPDA